MMENLNSKEGMETYFLSQGYRRRNQARRKLHSALGKIVCTQTFPIQPFIFIPDLTMAAQHWELILSFVIDKAGNARNGLLDVPL